MFLKKFIVFLLGSLFVFSLSAHEMWIEPVQYKVALNDTIYAHEKVGQNFKGNEYAYLSTSYKELLLTVNGNTTDVKSRIGDLPAIHESANEAGLIVLSAQTTNSVLTYETWEKFESFIKSHDLNWVLGKHRDKGLPESNFSEVYRRYPKALVKVGHGKGQDQLLGMPLEWLAETNPYTSDSDVITLRLFWLGKPFIHAHVDVFNRMGKQLVKSELITDKEGRVDIPRADGGQFMINAVQVIEASEVIKKEDSAVWESLWASITYEVSDKN